MSPIKTKDTEDKTSRIPPTISAKSLGLLLGLSQRRINELAADGTISRIGHGVYPLPAAVAGYCKFIRSSGQPADLKERELTLKCEKLEQEIHNRRTDLKAEVRKEMTTGVIEAAQIIRDAYLKLALNKKQMAMLKAAFAKAEIYIQKSHERSDD